MAEEEEYEEEEDDASQNKAVVNNENKEPTSEKVVEQKSEEKKDTHSKKSKGKSSKINKVSKNNDNAYKLPKPEQVVSTRAFLESTVTTTIHEALLELARKRDEIQDPLTFVGEYLIRKAKEKNQ